MNFKTIVAKIKYEMKKNNTSEQKKRKKKTGAKETQQQHYNSNLSEYKCEISLVCNFRKYLHTLQCAQISYLALFSFAVCWYCY